MSSLFFLPICYICNVQAAYSPTYCFLPKSTKWACFVHITSIPSLSTQFHYKFLKGNCSLCTAQHIDLHIISTRPLFDALLSDLFMILSLFWRLSWVKWLFYIVTECKCSLPQSIPSARKDNAEAFLTGSSPRMRRGLTGHEEQNRMIRNCFSSSFFYCLPFHMEASQRDKY